MTVADRLHALAGRWHGLIADGEPWDIEAENPEEGLTGMDVIDNKGANRFEVTVEGRLAMLEYRRTEATLDLIATRVPDVLEGRGLGGVLVRGALDVARRDGLAVIPTCPFVRTWFERHADELEGIVVIAASHAR